MLILSRHKNEQIMLGDDILITVVAIRGGRVKLGITAPDDTRILRQETAQAKEREKDRE